MERLKIKNKNGTEFIINFDNTEELIAFIIRFTDEESLHNIMSFIGVEDDN